MRPAPRRLVPSRFAICVPMSRTRASNSRCFGVCAPGMNSSLETDCTGIGEANNDSADARRSSSSDESMLMASSWGWRARGVERAFCHRGAGDLDPFCDAAQHNGLMGDVQDIPAHVMAGSLVHFAYVCPPCAI